MPTIWPKPLINQAITEARITIELAQEAMEGAVRSADPRDARDLLACAKHYIRMAARREELCSAGGFDVLRQCARLHDQRGALLANLPPDPREGGPVAIDGADLRKIVGMASVALDGDHGRGDPPALNAFYPA